MVDRVDGDSAPVETLKQEVRNTLLNGAAVFFPDRQTRRDHLFTMMVITHVGSLEGWQLGFPLSFARLLGFGVSGVHLLLTLTHPPLGPTRHPCP